MKRYISCILVLLCCIVSCNAQSKIKNFLHILSLAHKNKNKSLSLPKKIYLLAGNVIVSTGISYYGFEDGKEGKLMSQESAKVWLVAELAWPFSLINVCRYFAAGTVVQEMLLYKIAYGAGKNEKKYFKKKAELENSLKK